MENLKEQGRTIAVIITSYNYAPYIASAIESVLAQSRIPNEIIVVDDGSIDGSSEIAERYSDRVVVILKQNGGQASAFNVGYAESSSDIIMFLDSDDRLLPNCVESILDAWQPGTAKIHFPLDVINESGVATGEIRPGQPLAFGQLRDQVLSTGGYMTAPTSGNAFARDALIEIMPLPTELWRTYADCPLLFLSPFHGAVICLSQALGQYRVHASNASGLVRNGQLQMDAIRREIVRDIRQQAMLVDYCSIRSLPLRPDAVLSTWYSCKARLVSIAVNPAAHPLQQESRWNLLQQTLSAIWSPRTGLSIGQRLTYSIWSLVMTVAARRQAQKFGRFAYDRPGNGGFAA